jgi:hypothetical protein
MGKIHKRALEMRKAAYEVRDWKKISNNDYNTWKKRVEQAESFWEDYWTALGNALWTYNTESKDYSKTDNTLFFEKDNWWVLWKYYNKSYNAMKWFDIKDGYDGFWDKGITWLNTRAAIKNTLQTDTNWLFRTHPFSWKENYWKEIIKYVWSIKDKEYDSHNVENNNTLQHKELIHQIREIIAGFKDIWLLEKNEKNHFSQLADWWISMKNFENFKSDDILAWHHDNELSPIVNNILRGWSSWIVESTKKITNELMEQ